MAEKTANITHKQEEKRMENGLLKKKVYVYIDYLLWFNLAND